MLSGIVCAPQEVLMVQQQKLGGTLVQQAGSIVKNHGILTIFRALPATSVREGLYTVGFLALAPIFAEKMRQREGFSGSASEELQARVVGAICGGLTGGFFSHPFDFVKTNQQGDVAKDKFKGFFQTATVLYKEFGAAAFFRGLPWRCTGICMNAFMINNFKDLFAPIVFPSAFQ
jgi:hypothetical protein